MQAFIKENKLPSPEAHEQSQEAKGQQNEGAMAAAPVEKGSEQRRRGRRPKPREVSELLPAEKKTSNQIRKAMYKCDMRLC